MIDVDLLRLQAVKTGLGIKYLAKDERISILLAQLHEIFSDTVVLKGGTAVNRGYLQPRQRGRFSEDIDLDYPRHQSLTTKINTIKTLMKKTIDFEISPPRMLHQTLRFDCHYVNQLDEKDRVQVEFYLSDRDPTQLPQTMLLQSPYTPASATLFTVYTLEELLAQKIITLYARGEGKDMYDVFYLLDLSFKKTIVQNACTQLFIHYHIPLDYAGFITELLKKLVTLQSNAKYIGNTTNHFIPQQLRPDWTIFINMLREKIEQKLI
jgi:hypothetical protein